MQELKVIGIEDDALVAVGDDGERFRSPSTRCCTPSSASSGSDHGHRAASCRPARSRRTSAPACRRRRSPPSPARRSRTSSASRVRSLAEREHVVARRSACPCTPRATSIRGEGTTFGTVDPRAARRRRRVGRTLDELEGDDRLDRQARVHRRPDRSRRALGLRRRASTPRRRSTPTRSSSRRQGSLPRILIPRLRAVLPHDSEPGRLPLRQRCIHVRRVAADCSGRTATSRSPSRSRTAGRDLGEQLDPVSAIKRADEPRPTCIRPPTCSRRCAAAVASASRVSEVDDVDDRVAPAPEPRSTRRAARHLRLAPRRRARRAADGCASTLGAGRPRRRAGRTAPSSVRVELDRPQGRRRKGRTSMPSWDEIVFGARTDDDLA